MYKHAESLICLNNEGSDKFPCRKGVCQGCNLSPLLLCLFISDLEKFLKQEETEGATLTTSKVCLLLFADDLVLLANSIQAIQTVTDLLSEYCIEWGSKVNLTETEIFPFTMYI